MTGWLLALVGGSGVVVGALATAGASVYNSSRDRTASSARERDAEELATISAFINEVHRCFVRALNDQPRDLEQMHVAWASVQLDAPANLVPVGEFLYRSAIQAIDAVYSYDIINDSEEENVQLKVQRYHQDRRNFIDQVRFEYGRERLGSYSWTENSTSYGGH